MPEGPASGGWVFFPGCGGEVFGVLGHCLVLLVFTGKAIAARLLGGPSPKAVRGAGVTHPQDKRTEALPTKAPR